MKDRKTRALMLAAVAAVGLAAGASMARPPTAEAATIRRVLWSESYSRYNYQRLSELRARCAASAATSGVDYTEAHITLGPSSYAPSLFECIGVTNLMVTNPPAPVDRAQPTHQVAPPRWTP